MKSSVALALTTASFSLLLSSPAKALQVTTAFVPFSFQNTSNPNSPTRTPASLTFESFSSLYTGPGTLVNVTYKLASASNGTGNASATGSGLLLNSGNFSTSATLSAVTYKLDLNFPNSVNITKPVQSASSISCNTSAPTSPNCSNLTASSISAATGTTAFFNFSGAYSGLSNPFGLNNTQRAFFTSGSTVTTTSPTYQVEWGQTLDTGDASVQYNNSNLSSFTNTFPKIDGYIALVYDYEEPPATTPGPLAILGAASAFAWSRKLRSRMSVSQG